MTIYITRFKINNIPQFHANKTQEQAENHINILRQNKGVSVNAPLQMAEVNSTTELIELINELNRFNG